MTRNDSTTVFAPKRLADPSCPVGAEDSSPRSVLPTRRDRDATLGLAKPSDTQLFRYSLFFIRHSSALLPCFPQSLTPEN